MREKTKKYEMVNISKSPLSKNKEEYHYFNSPVKVFSVLPMSTGDHYIDPKNLHLITQGRTSRKIRPDGKEVLILGIDWSDFSHVTEAIAMLRPEGYDDFKNEKRGRSKGSVLYFKTILRQLMAVRALHHSPIVKHKPKFFTGPNHIQDFKKAISTVQDLLIHYWNDEIVENEVPLSCTPHRGNSSLFKAP